LGEHLLKPDVEKVMVSISEPGGTTQKKYGVSTDAETP
jgi:hypothetical protein